MTKIDKYQKWTRTTAFYPEDQAMNYLLLGLVEEAGEVAGAMKKHLRGDYDDAEMYKRIVKEMGDVAWYLSRLADELGVPMSVVLEGNMMKLQGRKDTGHLSGDGDNRGEDITLAHAREKYNQEMIDLEEE